MTQLILKDFRILKFINLITIFICLVGGYIGVGLDNVIKSKLAYIFVVLMTSYLASLILGQKEVKTKSDIIINSLPIDRSLIVKSKYCFNIIYALLSSLIVFFSSNVLGSVFSISTSGAPMSFFDILIVLGLTLVFYSIYLLLYYFNMGKAQLFNQITYALLILSPSLLNRFNLDISTSPLFKSLLSMDFNKIVYLLVVLALVLYIISLNISIKIYQSKNL